MAYLHDKVGRDGRQQFWALCIQAQRHAMGAVRMNDALRRQAARRIVRGRINLAVQCNGFAGFVATDLSPVAIEQGQAGGV